MPSRRSFSQMTAAQARPRRFSRHSAPACRSAFMPGAVARSVPIRHLAIELSGDIDFGALWGTNDPAFKTSGFETIAVVVHIDSDAPRQTLKALVDYATLWSPVGNTLHNPVHLDVSLAD